MNEKVWIITGASRGFGRVWTEAALNRGDKVVAAVRNLDSVSALRSLYGKAILPVQLDVGQRAQAHDAAAKAIDAFGRVDVLINNAGYCLTGALEELEEREVRQSIDTNILGSLWLTQAVLPHMREQRCGHVIAVSSVSALIGQPTIGIYNAAKWAIEGMMEALSHEVSELGIKVSIIEPAIFSTEFTSGESMRFSKPINDYEGARSRLYASLASEPSNDPRSTIDAVFGLVDGENPPLRLLLGETALRWAVKSYSERLTGWVR